MKSKINPEKKTLEEKLNETFKTKTESIELYPAGRGKVLILTKKKVLPKPKKYKKSQPRFGHVLIKANPNPIQICEYLDTTGEYNRKHVYFFPEARELTHEEREDIALSLLATLPHTYNTKLLSKGIPNKSSKKLKFPIFLNTRQRQILKQKWKRYVKWRKRHDIQN